MGELGKDRRARSWEDLKRDLEFTPAEQAEVCAGAQLLIAQARAVLTALEISP